MEQSVASRPVDSGSAESEAPTMRGKLGLYLGVVGGTVLLDIATKLLVQRTLRFGVPIPVWGDFFRLTYIYNPGAAFGLHLGAYSRFVFMGLAIVMVVLLFSMYRSTPTTDKVRLLAIASVTGGAIGNLIDRVRSHRGVVDFLDFGIGHVRWPVFNVADIAVTTGAILLAISLWREEEPQSSRTAAAPE